MFTLLNSMCSTPYGIDNLIYIGCNDFHHPFLEPSPLSSGDGPFLFYSKKFRRIRLPMNWYICASHLPGWYSKSYQCKRPLILAKILHHGWGKFWILTAPIWFKLPFGKAFAKSVFMSNIDFPHQKALDPPFLKPSPFVLNNHIWSKEYVISMFNTSVGI